MVPDPRVHRLIAERVWAVGPTTIPVRLHGHVFLAPDGHPTERLGQWMRWAMVESGLVVPEDAGLVAPVQLDWGWQDHEARE